MAEIKIVQKKQVGLWLLAVIVIAILLYYFLVFRDNSNNIATEVVTETKSVSGTNKNNLLGIKENNNTVATFVSFVENDSSRVGIDYAFTNEALLKLTAAINAMAGEIGYDIRADLEKLKESIVLISNEPFETSQAKNIRIAADNSVIALQNMQLAKYPWLTDEVEALKSASVLINPEKLTINQKDAVLNYFSKASDLLQKMN
jgi:hypothetical protein